jgi:hypothetical protein
LGHGRVFCVLSQAFQELAHLGRLEHPAGHLLRDFAGLALVELDDFREVALMARDGGAPFGR